MGSKTDSNLGWNVSSKRLDHFIALDRRKQQVLMKSLFRIFLATARSLHG